MDASINHLPHVHVISNNVICHCILLILSINQLNTNSAPRSLGVASIDSGESLLVDLNVLHYLEASGERNSIFSNEMSFS